MNLFNSAITPIQIAGSRWDELPAKFKALGFIRGAEIGVRRGSFSEKLCQTIPNLQLLAVDPWQTYPTSPRMPSQARQDANYTETQNRLAPFPKALLIKQTSMEAVKDVALASLDFVFIDGHHGFDFVSQDLEAWGQRVRRGGIISGDDYGPSAPGVTEAVNAYVIKHQISPWFITTEPHNRNSAFFWINN